MPRFSFISGVYGAQEFLHGANMCPETQARVHAHRIAGGHSYHRNSDWATTTGCAKGAGGCRPDTV